MLFLANIDHHVTVSGVLADNHPLIDLCLRLDKERSTVLGMVHGIGNRLPLVHGDQNAPNSAWDLSLERLIVMEMMIENSGPFGIGQKFRPVTEKTAGGNFKLT